MTPCALSSSRARNQKAVGSLMKSSEVRRVEKNASIVESNNFWPWTECSGTLTRLLGDIQETVSNQQPKIRTFQRGTTLGFQILVTFSKGIYIRPNLNLSISEFFLIMMPICNTYPTFINLMLLEASTTRWSEMCFKTWPNRNIFIEREGYHCLY